VSSLLWGRGPGWVLGDGGVALEGTCFQPGEGGAARLEETPLKAGAEAGWEWKRESSRAWR